jgi:LmbE family N-acetylglucosaminyl deacetylase
VAGYIRATAPDLVLTFDPRHGTTCHPDHRAVGQIVLEATATMSPSPQVYLLESRVTFATQPFAPHFSPAIEGAIRFNANQSLSWSHDTAWQAVLDDMRRHPSQFDANWLMAIDDLSLDERAVYVLPAAVALSEPAVTCP